MAGNTTVGCITVTTGRRKWLRWLPSHLPSGEPQEFLLRNANKQANIVPVSFLSPTFKICRNETFQCGQQWQNPCWCHWFHSQFVPESWGFLREKSVLLCCIHWFSRGVGGGGETNAVCPLHTHKKWCFPFIWTVGHAVLLPASKKSWWWWWWWLFPHLRGFLGECMTVHSLPALFCKVEICVRTLIPFFFFSFSLSLSLFFFFLPQSVHSGAAQLTSCVWAHFQIGSHTMLGQRHSPLQLCGSRACVHV